VPRELHVPEDVLVRRLERDAICNTASLEYPELEDNGTGANMIRLSTEWIAAVLSADPIAMPGSVILSTSSGPG
jgi:hypothetical protein